MNINHSLLVVHGLDVLGTRKNIKYLYLLVYPPDGRVRVSAPEFMGDEAIRLAVITKMGWICRQQQRFRDQPRQSRREMVGGESHYYQGQRYLLSVVEKDAPSRVRTLNNRVLELQVRPGTDRDRREAGLYAWYRAQLKGQIPGPVAKWEPIVGVQVAEWGVKRVKTRQGSCNIEARRIWLSVELIKKPPICLEYVLVHEMVHLLERHHNERFRALMTKFMPNWRHCRDILNSAPLAYEEWEY